MKRNKDFTYYGKKRVRVQKLLRSYENFKINLPYVFVPLVLIALIIDFRINFSFYFMTTCGVLSLILFAMVATYVFCIVDYLVLSYLDKYYLKKRKVLFEKYLAEKGIKHIVIGQ